MSTIESIIKGGSVESYRYHTSVQANPSSLTQKILTMKEKMKRKRPIEYFKGLIPSLVQHGFLRQDTMKSKHTYSVSQIAAVMSVVCMWECSNMCASVQIFSQPLSLHLDRDRT